jgi:quercetin dioxygenase-like cupin family protein
MKRNRLIVAIAIATALATALVAEAKQKQAVTAAADTLSWKDFNPQRPGVKVAAVSGDLTKGAWKGLLKYPAGNKAPLHTHSADSVIVVISGTFRFGDTSENEKPYGPGSYIFVPAGMPHTNSTPEETMIFIEQPAKYDTKLSASAAK